MPSNFQGSKQVPKPGKRFIDSLSYSLQEERGIHSRKHEHVNQLEKTWTRHES